MKFVNWFIANQTKWNPLMNPLVENSKNLLISTFYTFSRWSQHFLWFVKHLRAHCYVQLLSLCCNGSTVPEIFVVEEVLNNFTNGKFSKRFPFSKVLTAVVLRSFLGPICPDNGSCVPTVVHRLQLSQGICLVDRNARRHVLLLVQWILQGDLQEESKSLVAVAIDTCWTGLNWSTKGNGRIFLVPLSWYFLFPSQPSYAADAGAYSDTWIGFDFRSTGFIEMSLMNWAIQLHLKPKGSSFDDHLVIIKWSLNDHSVII